MPDQNLKYAQLIERANSLIPVVQEKHRTLHIQYNDSWQKDVDSFRFECKRHGGFILLKKTRLARMLDYGGNMELIKADFYATKDLVLAYRITDKIELLEGCPPLMYSEGSFHINNAESSELMFPIMEGGPFFSVLGNQTQCYDFSTRNLGVKAGPLSHGSRDDVVKFGFGDQIETISVPFSTGKVCFQKIIHAIDE